MIDVIQRLVQPVPPRRQARQATPLRRAAAAAAAAAAGCVLLLLLLLLLCFHLLQSSGTQRVGTVGHHVGTCFARSPAHASILCLRKLPAGLGLR
jgi:hypothetical protein